MNNLLRLHFFFLNQAFENKEFISTFPRVLSGIINEASIKHTKPNTLQVFGSTLH